MPLSLRKALTRVEGHAVVAVTNGVGKTVADLGIDSSSGQITVSEAIVGTAFPARYSERHIQVDCSFCIGYEAGLAIRTVDETKI